MGFKGPTSPISRRMKPDDPLPFLFLAIFIIAGTLYILRNKILAWCPWLGSLFEKLDNYKPVGDVLLWIVGIFILVTVLWMFLKGPDNQDW